MAGDFSPLSVDSSGGGPRHAPPALVVAIAVGLASMDMPIPHLDSWQWTNWKFPRQVMAGDTLYARWTLTQKRAPARGSKASIVVWRVDVHTADGAVCAEGEVGASIFRSTSPAAAASVEVGQEPGPAAAVPAPRRRRRGKRGAGGEAPAPPPAPPAPTAQPAAAQQERAGGGRRRRRRRTSSGGGNGNQVAPATAAPSSAPATPVAATPVAGPNASRLSRVMKRLRGASS